jgi:hypothetical protein
MTTDRDFDRFARGWLDLMPDEAPDRTVAAVLQAVETTPQVRRPIRRLTWRSSTMNRLPIALGAAAVVVVAGTLLLSRAGTSPPVAASTSPIATTAPTAAGALTTQTGPLVYGSRSHAATVVLRDGRVLVIGGSPTHRAELWDPATGRFSATGEATLAGDDPAAVLLDDGRVLIVTAEARAAELYDPTTGAFSTTGAMRAFRGRCHCGVSYMQSLGPKAAVLADGRVLVTGGHLPPTSDNQARPDYADVFDPQTGTFSQVDTRCDAARGATATLADGRVLVTCVTNAGGQSIQAQVFDPRTNEFATTGSLTSIDNEFAFLLKDGRVLLAGDGRRDGATHAELYDAASRTFSPVPGDNPTVAAPGVTLADGRVLFLGQDRAFSWLYDPTAGRFTRVLSGVSLGVSGTPAALLRDGRVLVIGAGATATVLDPRLIP